MDGLQNEWAQDAVEAEEAYLLKLLDVEKGLVFFGSKEEDDAAYTQFRRRFPAMNIERIDDDALSSAERYALNLEWRSVRRRLGGSSVLTLLRKDAYDASERRRLCLVPESQWAVIELARCRELYGPEGMERLGKSYRRKEDDEQEATCNISFEGNERKLLTARPVEPGDTLFTEKVHIVACYESTKGFGDGGGCFHCGRSSKSNTVVQAACSGLIPSCCGLRSFAFCGTKCLRLYEKRHQAECTAARYAIFNQDKIPPFKALLAIRAALWWSETPSLEDSAAHGDVLSALKDHREDLAKTRPEYLENISVLAQKLAPLLSGCTVQRLEHLLCSIDVNAMALGADACGLAPHLAAACNHSCLENATHYADWELGPGEPRLIFKAVMPLHAGQEILICYLGENDLALPTEERRALLKTSKHFICNCKRCITCTKKQLTTSLEATNLIDEARTLLENAKALHPDRFAVAIAATAENLGDALAQTTAQAEAVAAYELAISNLRVCRGQEEVQRILRKHNDLKAAKATGPVEHDASRNIVLEIKTWEPVSAEALLQDLAPRLATSQPLQPKFYVHWHEKATTTPLAYGLSALVLSCTVQSNSTALMAEGEDNGSTLLRSIDTIELDLAESLSEAFAEDIQSVDVGAVSGSSDDCEEF